MSDRNIQPVDIDTTKLDDFAAELGLEFMMASPVTAARYVNVPGVRVSEIRVYDWPAKVNGTKNDRFVDVGLYSDGTFTVSLRTEAYAYSKQIGELRRAVKAR